MKAIDVVTVPDFSGRGRSIFEARTLLFLAAWIEHAGAARAFPLHLACIGDPPDSVQWLARLCGARISVHAPVAAEHRGSANKLRGLDVEGREERVLLLDVDVLVLSDISVLAGLDQGIAVAPAMRARVPDRYWRRIYPALGMEMPTERIPCVASALQCGVGPASYPEQRTEWSAMLPYYNSGVILAPWGCGLRRVWEDHIRRIAALFRPEDESWSAVGMSDQAGLATALQWLKAQGTPIGALPPRCHAHWLFLYRNQPTLDDFAAFHAIFVFGKTRRVDAMLPLQLHRYRLHLMHRLLNEWWRDERSRSRMSLALEYLLPSLARANRLSARLGAMYRKHVGPALRQNVTQPG